MCPVPARYRVASTGSPRLTQSELRASAQRGRRSEERGVGGARAPCAGCDGVAERDGRRDVLELLRARPCRTPVPFRTRCVARRETTLHVCDCVRLGRRSSGSAPASGYKRYNGGGWGRVTTGGPTRARRWCLCVPRSPRPSRICVASCISLPVTSSAQWSSGYNTCLIRRGFAFDRTRYNELRPPPRGARALCGGMRGLRRNDNPESGGAGAVAGAPPPNHRARRPPGRNGRIDRESISKFERNYAWHARVRCGLGLGVESGNWALAPWPLGYSALQSTRLRCAPFAPPRAGPASPA